MSCRIVIVSPLGGIGKTTIATNLACFAANSHLSTAIVDLDPQHSSANWIKRRPQDRTSIRSYSFDRNRRATKIWQLNPGSGAEYVVVDFPNKTTTHDLRHEITNATHILVPITPILNKVPVEIHNTLDRIMLDAPLQVRISVIINRAAQDTTKSEALYEFLSQRKIPLLAILKETSDYMASTEKGLGISELTTQTNHPNIDILAQWEPILRWTGIAPFRPSKKTLRYSHNRKVPDNLRPFLRLKNTSF